MICPISEMSQTLVDTYKELCKKKVHYFKECLEQFGFGLDPPSPTFGKCPNRSRFFVGIASLSNTPFDKRSLIHRKVWFPTCFVRQNQQKTNFFCAAILDHFQTKMFKSETTSFHHFSPRIPNL